MQLNIITTVLLLLHHFVGEFNLTEPLHGIITHASAIGTFSFHLGQMRVLEWESQS